VRSNDALNGRAGAFCHLAPRSRQSRNAKCNEKDCVRKEMLGLQDNGLEIVCRHAQILLVHTDRLLSFKSNEILSGAISLGRVSHLCCALLVRFS
jgi:hypothetical protein